jgi:MFS family permease
VHHRVAAAIGCDLAKLPVEQSLGANPADAALNPANSVAMGVQSTRTPRFLTSPRGRVFRALAHREYRLLFAAFGISQTGFWLSHISMQGLMVELSGNDPRYLGFLFFCLFIPAFLLAPAAGLVADRLDRQRILLVCQTSVALLAGTLAVLTARHVLDAHTMLLLATLLGTSFAFSGPASYALAANAVPSPDLPSAVSLSSAANNLTRVVGPLIAAPLIATGHFDIAFAGYFGAILAAAWLIASMRVSPYVPDETETSIAARLRSGLSHARERRPAVPALFTVAALSLFGVSHVALLPVYAEEVLGDQHLFAWIVVATGLGAIAGALGSGARSARPSLVAAALRLLGYGIALAMFALTHSLVLALLLQIAIGYFYFAVMTSLQTLLQEIVDDGKRGRVMSLFQIAWAGLVPFGGLGMGIVAGAIGVAHTLLCAAGICAAFGAGMALRARREDV